ncbi:2Fe-2S iron-sulfur cluster-binding protein [Thalassotalea nanhaiensis]|uniref:2Fe-2S iron-sulfur cluster-binding protein n=1 Tax=Thalassotalea nanhaiensis TaxID=3065648 RepID=A0ABY9TEV9_9GAMM|nr:2Fe-2S iron-sulfur cluster-binding protein [Colwelliaceae bacterium SQ345]
MGQVTFIETCGTVHEVEIAKGSTLLDAAIQNSIPGMPGACGGDAVCATCHCTVEDEWLNKLPEMSEDEFFMLQSMDDHQPNSRLGCQIRMKDDLDGMIVIVQDN